MNSSFKGHIHVKKQKKKKKRGGMFGNTAD